MPLAGSQGVEEGSLHPYLPAGWRHTVHIARKLKAISNIQLGIAIKDKLQGRRKVNIISAEVGSLRRNYFPVQVYIQLLIIGIFFWQE